MDVVKTRMQLDPVKYNKGMIGGFSQVIKAEGAGALLTGLGPTAQGYFIQGWFKFGGVEYFKINITKKVGEKFAWENRNSIYLLSSAMAEFIADIFLCPLPVSFPYLKTFLFHLKDVSTQALTRRAASDSSATRSTRRRWSIARLR